MQQDTTKYDTYRTVGIVVSVSLHVLVIGLLLVSCLGKKDPPQLIKEIQMPAGSWEAIPVTPIAPQPPSKEPAPPEPPKPAEPEPSKPEPSKPEPPKPEPPKPEPPKPEPPKPEKVESPKKELPKPKEVDKPKSKQDQLKDRLKASEKTKTPTQTKTDNTPKRDNTADITKRINRAASSTAVAPAITYGNPNGLKGAELTAFDKYMVNVLGPIMQALWDQLGPDRLNNTPKPVQVTLIVSPTGRVISAVVSGNSDNPQMNDGAKKLAAKMLSRQMQPFSSVGLPSKSQLTFIYNLEYRQENR